MTSYQKARLSIVMCFRFRFYLLHSVFYQLEGIRGELDHYHIISQNLYKYENIYCFGNVFIRNFITDAVSFKC